jgi:hypothetical protein
MSRCCAGNLSLYPALVDHLSSSLVLQYRPTLYPFLVTSPFLVPALLWWQDFPCASIAPVCCE